MGGIRAHLSTFLIFEFSILAQKTYNCHLCTVQPLNICKKRNLSNLSVKPTSWDTVCQTDKGVDKHFEDFFKIEFYSALLDNLKKGGGSTIKMVLFFLIRSKSVKILIKSRFKCQKNLKLSKLSLQNLRKRGKCCKVGLQNHFYKFFISDLPGFLKLRPSFLKVRMLF